VVFLKRLKIIHNKVAAIDWVLVGTVLVVVFGYILLHDLLGGFFLDHNSWTATHCRLWHGKTAA
jgi:hypothetical protein